MRIRRAVLAVIAGAITLGSVAAGAADPASASGSPPGMVYHADGTDPGMVYHA